MELFGCTLELPATTYLAGQDTRMGYNLFMQEIAKTLKPGVRVKVCQQIGARDHALMTELSGTVVSFDQRKTGSWFAHSKDDRLWLDRLVLKKDDGEVSSLILDQYSRVELVS